MMMLEDLVLADDAKQTSRGRPPEDALDRVRRRLLMRSRELGLTLADLSRHVEMNETYVHQFVWRGTPRMLDETVRKKLADILRIDEDELRPETAPVKRPRPPLPSRMALLQAHQVAQTQQISASGNDVPVFTEFDKIDPAAATDWTARPSVMASSVGAFAVWIERPHGSRLSAGDLAFVRGQQPARAGDPVVVLRGQELVAIGDLVSTADGHATIRTTGDKPTRIATDGARVLKIVAVHFA